MDISQQTDRHYMALHLITAPDAGMVQDGKRHQEMSTRMQFYDYFGLYDNITLIVVFVVT